MADRRNVWTRRVGRRALLRSAGTGTAGLAGAALIGCGEDEEAPEATATGAAPAGTATPGAASPGGPTRGGTWQGRSTGDPPTLDPYASGSAWTKGFAAYVYSRLLRIDAQPDTNPYDQPVIPDAAEGFEAADGQVWTFTLRPGVKFHNIEPVSGRDLTSEDVLYSWAQLTRPESVNAAAVESVTKIDAVDDQTIRFELQAPSPIFPELIADGNNLWILPAEADGQFEVTTKPIGTGPWIMENYLSSSRFDFVRHPEYFEEGVPNLDAARDSIIPEYANAKAQMEAGNLHLLAVTADDVLELSEAHPDWQWMGDVTGGVGYLFFSSTEMDPDALWQDERYRQATSLAINRDEMNEAGYNVNALKAAGLDPSDAWQNLISVALGRWWLDPQSEAQGPSARFFEYDPAEARKLLEAVGAVGTHIKWQYAGARYGRTFELFAEAIGNWMSEIGLDVETEVQDYAAVYFPQTRAGNFHGVAFGLSPAYPEVSGFVDRHFSDSSSNASRIQDPDIDELRQKQAVEFDLDTRREQIYEIQRINAEYMYYVPTQMGAGTSYTAYHPDVRGIRRTRGYGGPTEVLARQWLEA